jgi:hypothetical protein
VTSESIRRVLATALALTLSASGVAIAGKPSEAGPAQALFDEAQKDIDAKRWDAAIEKLERAVKLVPDAIGARLTLADCYENAGRLGSAWEQYSVAVALAEKEKQPARADKARKQASALRAKVAVVKLVVPDAARAQGLQVFQDDKPIAEALWGTDIPVDSGREIVFRASASGRKAWTTRIFVKTDGSNTKIDVPVLDKEAGWDQAIEEQKHKEATSRKPTWMDFTFGGVRGFVGAGIGGGPYAFFTTEGFNAGQVGVIGGIQLSARGGVIIDRHEVGIEVSLPLWYTTDNDLPVAFQVNAAYAYLAKITKLPAGGRPDAIELYWPLRVGLGTIVLVDDDGDATALFQARADVVGVGLQVGNLLLEVNAPSVRFFAPDRGFHMLFGFGLNASYMF